MCVLLTDLNIILIQRYLFLKYMKSSNEYFYKKITKVDAHIYAKGVGLV